MAKASRVDRLRARFSPRRMQLYLRGRPAVLARRGLAVALLLTAAVLAALPAPAGGREPGRPTLVAARDLQLGSTLSPADLRVAELPESARPTGVLATVEAATGRVLASAARAGEPITDARLVGPLSTPPGSATVPIRLADAGVTGLLHPGLRVDVVTVGPDERGRRVLDHPATVLTVRTPDDQARDGPGRAAQGPLVLLSVPSGAATRLAAVSLEHPVTVTLR